MTSPKLLSDDFKIKVAISVRILRSLNDLVRRRMLGFINEREFACINEIVAELRLSKEEVIKHLRILEKSKIIIKNKTDFKGTYHIDHHRLAKISSIVKKLAQ